MATRFVDRLCQHFLRVAEFVNEPAVRLRLFDRVQILPLDVLDQRNLQRFAVGVIADDDRHFVKARALRGAPAALTRDDLIIMAVRTHHDRLDDAAFRDRAGKLVQRVVVEMAARLIGVGSDRADRDHADAGGRNAVQVRRRIVARDVAQQRAEPAAKTATRSLGIGHAATSSTWGRRAINSRASAIYACDPLHR